MTSLFSGGIVDAGIIIYPDEIHFGMSQEKTVEQPYPAGEIPKFLHSSISELVKRGADNIRIAAYDDDFRLEKGEHFPECSFTEYKMVDIASSLVRSVVPRWAGNGFSARASHGIVWCDAVNGLRVYAHKDTAPDPQAQTAYEWVGELSPVQLPPRSFIFEIAAQLHRDHEVSEIAVIIPRRDDYWQKLINDMGRRLPVNIGAFLAGRPELFSQFLAM